MSKEDQKIRTVGILFFDGVEVLDFAGPFEVFSVARPPEETDDKYALFKVHAIAENDRLITCTGGLRIQPDYTINNHPKLDILIVPGGMGTRRERLRSDLPDWIKTQDQLTELTTSVCTGALLLAESGILKGHRVTTHWRGISLLREFPDIKVVEGKRVIDEGHIITSAGISAGIDMSLYIVSRLYGEETAKWTAHFMEYNWQKPRQV